MKENAEYAMKEVNKTFNSMDIFRYICLLVCLGAAVLFMIYFR